MAGGKHILGKAKRHIFGTARVGEKGQIVIPKEARQIFGVQPGLEAGLQLRQNFFAVASSSPSRMCCATRQTKFSGRWRNRDGTDNDV